MHAGELAKIVDTIVRKRQHFIVADAINLYAPVFGVHFAGHLGEPRSHSGDPPLQSPVQSSAALPRKTTCPRGLGAATDKAVPSTDRSGVLSAAASAARSGSPPRSTTLQPLSRVGAIRSGSLPDSTPDV